jgi:2-polyprenyl-3-methyl-5-hydroxy-6-metoxy-1,4-benzoquinol methylase
LIGRAPVTGITAVDTDSELLEAFSQRAERLDVLVRLLLDRWPDLVEQAGPADVVMCGHVVYNVADLGPFIAALTASARSGGRGKGRPRHWRGQHRC